MLCYFYPRAFVSSAFGTIEMVPGKFERSPYVAFGQQWFCGSLHVVRGPFVTSWLCRRRRRRRHPFQPGRSQWLCYYGQIGLDRRSTNTLTQHRMSMMTNGTFCCLILWLRVRRVASLWIQVWRMNLVCQPLWCTNYSSWSLRCKSGHLLR